MPCHHEMTNTLTADWHSPAVAMQTGHTKGNGSGFNEEDVSYTLSRANDHAVAAFGIVNDTTPKVSEGDDAVHTLRARRTAGGSIDCVAFAQNNRMEGSLICMASGQANAEISGGATRPLRWRRDSTRTRRSLHVKRRRCVPDALRVRRGQAVHR